MSLPGSARTAYVPQEHFDHPDEDNKGFGYFAMKRPATGKWVFIFDPNYDAWAAYNENGDLVNTGRASGGQDYCPDINRPCRTPVGKFRIARKGDADCESSIFPIDTNGGAPMPYCMFFDGGFAVHGSYELPPSGNVSHGCIRVTPEAAAWISDNFMLGSSVVVLPYNG